MTTTNAHATGLAERARAAYHDRERAQQQAAAKRQAAWTAEVQQQAAEVAAWILYQQPATSADVPAEITAEHWTPDPRPELGEDIWSATATVEGLRWRVHGFRGSYELYLLQPCPACGQDDRRASVVCDLADLGAALANPDQRGRCPTCADAEAAAVAAQQVSATAEPPESWQRRAIQAANRAHAGTAETSVLMDAAESIAYSLLTLAGGERR